MTIREFLNTCQMPWDKVTISYYGSPNDEAPQYMACHKDMCLIPEEWLDKHIDAWDVIVVYDRDGNEEITISMEV